MECVLVWLAVMAATFHMAQTQCMNRDATDSDSEGNYSANGEVVTGGRHGVNYMAAWISICIGGEWRQVCDDGWGRQGARVLCQQKGFSGDLSSVPCGDSCFGCGYNHLGITLDCTGTEEGLSQCRHGTALRTPCGRCAGVVCIMEGTVCPTSPDATTLPHVQTPATPPETATPLATCAPPEPAPAIGDNCTCPMGEGRASDHNSRTTGNIVGGVQQSCPSLAALGGGLGALTAILAILLVGVVMGWVWSCHRRSGLQERSLRTVPEPEETFPNPSYASTSHIQTGPSHPDATPPAIYEDIQEIQVQH